MYIIKNTKQGRRINTHKNMQSVDLSQLDTAYTASSKGIRDKSVKSIRNMLTKAASVPVLANQDRHLWRKRRPYGVRRKRNSRTVLGWLKFSSINAPIIEEGSSFTGSCGTFSDDDFSICSEELLAQAKNRLCRLNPTEFEDDDLLSVSNSLYTCQQSLGEKIHISEMTRLELADDDLSICSKDLLAKAKNRLRKPNPTEFEDDDLLSTSNSLNTCQQSDISGLKKKLHTSEITRFELINRYAGLRKKLENVDCNDAQVEEYRQQNEELREDSLNIERNFTNEVSRLVHQLTDINKKYFEMITEQDNKMIKMELEICRLKEENAKQNSISDKSKN